MWLFTRYGFFSVVCARTSARPGAPVDAGTVMVRARKRSHLEALIRRFVDRPRPGDRSDLLDWIGVKVVTSKGTDYPYRVFLSKAAWADASHDLATEMTWDDFKGHVHQELAADREYLAALHAVWDIGRRMTDARGR